MSSRLKSPPKYKDKKIVLPSNKRDDLIRATSIKDDEELLDLLKKLPIEPWHERNGNRTTTKMCIKVDKIFTWDVTIASKRLEDNKLEIARDGKFWLTNNDFLFTCLLKYDDEKSGGK